MQTPSSEKLSRLLPDLNRDMHKKGGFRGDSFKQHVPALLELVGDSLADLTILDFGCGGMGGLASGLGCSVRAYDPYVDAYSKDPWTDKDGKYTQYDVVFCSDVLEHMTVDEIYNKFLRKLSWTDDVLLETCPKFILVAVTCRAANKTLANGLNAHLTVEPPEWWFGLFQGVWQQSHRCRIARYDMITGEAVFGFYRNDLSPSIPRSETNTL